MPILVFLVSDDEQFLSSLRLDTIERTEEDLPASLFGAKPTLRANAPCRAHSNLEYLPNPAHCDETPFLLSAKKCPSFS